MVLLHSSVVTFENEFVVEGGSRAQGGWSRDDKLERKDDPYFFGAVGVLDWSGGERDGRGRSWIIGILDGISEEETRWIRESREIRGSCVRRVYAN